MGTVVTSPGVNESLAFRKPFISHAYISTLGNIIVYLSYPIFNDDNNYRGFIGGVIRTKGDNIISKITSRHYPGPHKNISIMDLKGNYIYNEDSSLIGTKGHDLLLNKILNKNKTSFHDGVFSLSDENYLGTVKKNKINKLDYLHTTTKIYYITNVTKLAQDYFN